MAYCQIFGKYYPMDAHACFLGFQYRKDYKLTVQKFTYSWLTNRMGTVWNIIKHPCADAFQRSRGSEFNHYQAVTTFSLPNMDNMLHDTNCSSSYPSAPIYPCAESYDGFDSASMNLDMSKWYLYYRVAQIIESLNIQSYPEYSIKSLTQSTWILNQILKP